MRSIYTQNVLVAASLYTHRVSLSGRDTGAAGRLQLRFPTAAAEAEGGDGGKKGTCGTAGDEDELPHRVTSSEVMTPPFKENEARIRVSMYMSFSCLTLFLVRIRMMSICPIFFEGRREKVYSFVACLSRMTIEQASLARRRGGAYSFVACLSR